jgi:menaquinone-dependent protoporphyrinogen oxidase
MADMRLLVGYATAHGSTKEIAERIAERLAAAGHDVDARAMADVEDADAYGACILGSAIHGGEWLPEGASFVRAHFATLTHRPVWLFSVSTVGETSSGLGRIPTWLARKAQRESRQVAGFREAIHAHGHRSFAGVVERANWGGFGNLFMRLMGGRFGDLRDWDDIDRWAAGIAAALAAQPTEREFRPRR